jgi:hypothetical protein
MIQEEWNKGVLVSRTVIEEKEADQIALRDTVNEAVNKLSAIVDATTMTNAEVLAAVKFEAQVQRAILRYFKKEIQR